MKPIIIYGIICEKADFLLTYSTYTATLNGFVAQVKIEAQYLNQDVEANEVRFVFPVEEDSAVYSFEANIGNKHLIAKCKDKEVARKEYEKAREAGKMAILLSETSTSGDIFEYRLGNIPAKETVSIHISMFSELSCESDGAVRFHVPFVLNQRYGQLPKDEVYKKEPKPKEFSFNATVNWPSGIEQIKAEDANQKIKVEFKDDKRQALVSLAEKVNFEKDMLFYVYYKNVSKPHAIVEKAESEGKELFGQDVMMVNLFPQLPDFKEQVGQEYVFIVDRSGSMQGNKIESAKQTLLFFLKSLPVECAFNVISFSNSYELLFADSSKQYNEESMAAALKFHSELIASGGTELLRTIRSLSSLTPYKGYFRQVFLMTDGEVYNTKEVIDAVKSQTKESRFFTVGIGSGASTELVKGIARAGHGKAEFVMENDNLNKKVMSLLKLSMQPVVSNVSLVAKSGQEKFSFTPVPKHIPSIFSEERFILYLILDKIEKDLKSVTLTLSGKVGEARFSQDFTVDFDGKNIVDMYVHRLCGRKMVQKLEEDDLGENEGKSKERIIRLATAANLVSKYTAFQAECDIPNAYCEAPIMCRASFSPQKMHKKGSPKMLSMPAPSVFSQRAYCVMKSCDVMEDYTSEESIEPAAAKDTLMYLITLQTFIGIWKLDEHLAGFFHMSLAELQNKKPTVSDEIWGTVLAVVLMRQKFCQQKLEWELIENKAVRWLESQSLGQISLGDLFAAASKLIPKD